MDEEIRIFTESSEDMGLMFKSYEPIFGVVTNFLGNIENCVHDLVLKPTDVEIDLSDAIKEFKSKVNVKFIPSEIEIKSVSSTMKKLKKFRSDLDSLLNRFVRLKNITAFGGNYYRAIIKRPKVYSKEIDDAKYAIINKNVRNIARSMDWVEKVIIDLFNMTDQDINILNIVNRVYIKKHIYESAETGLSNDDKYLTSKIYEIIGNTPEEISAWMQKNISYDKTVSGWKLRTPAETFKDRAGNCHDQSWFIAIILNNMHYKVGQLFFVEFSKNKTEGGNTHTLTWYMDEEKNYYWFENAWEDQAGIHGPYSSIQELKEAILDIYNKDDDINSHEYDGIVFSSRSKYHEGMTLGEYVESWVLEDDYLFTKSPKEDAITESLNWISNFAENDMFRESVSNPMNMSDPESFLKWMGCIEYGWTNPKDKSKHGTGPKDDENLFYKEYRLQSPSDLIKSKVGVCWDQCELERKWFNKHNFKFAIFYIEIDDKKNSPSHTFLVYQKVNHFYWFEHSWGQNRGIHRYDTLEALLKGVLRKHQKQHDDFNSPIIFRILTTAPSYGCTCKQYMKHAHDSVKVDVTNYPTELIAESRIFTSGDFDEYKLSDEAWQEVINRKLPTEESQKFTEADNSDAPPPLIDDEDKSAPEEEKKPEKESLPKKTDKAESSKNGVRRKKLYIAFIEWCKEYNPKNTFGSIFDKDAFNVSYPFVPEPMRYFYRLANPMLCVLSGDLTFFPVAELRKLNAKNSKLSEMMIFAATADDVRVFNNKDKKVYRGEDVNGALTLKEVLGDTFDLYIQNMIKKGDILNGPIEECTTFDFE